MLNRDLIRIVVLALAGLSGWPVRASAQQPSAQAGGASQALQEAARARSVVRVVLLSGDTVAGPIVQIGGDFRVAEQRLSASRVGRIEALLRTPDPLGNGLVIGATAGALAGLVVAAYSSGYADSPRPSALPGVLISAGIGAAAGAVVDYTIVRRGWQALWP